MDANTFGKCEASKNLAEILNKLKDERISYETTRIIHKKSIFIKSLKEMYLNYRNKPLFMTMYRMAKKEWNGFKKDTLPEIVCSHIKCVIDTRFKEAFREVMKKKI